jgi:hypothetical protein
VARVSPRPGAAAPGEAAVAVPDEAAVAAAPGEAAVAVPDEAAAPGEVAAVVVPDEVVAEAPVL